MAISTNGTVLARVAGALYNTQMSNATYSEVASLDPATLTDALYARDFSASTDAAVATTLVANLGLTAVEGLANWVAAQLTAAGSHKGAKVVELLNGFAQMSADATYGAAATAFNTKVDAALALSQTTGNAGGTFGAATTPVGATFKLTAGLDTFVGKAGDDSIIANTDAGALTLTSLDNLDAGAGADTLTAAVVGALDATGAVAATIKNIETANLTSTGAVTVTSTDWTGLTSLNTSSIGNTTVTAAATTDATLTVASPTGAGAVAFNGGKNVVVSVVDTAAANTATGNTTILGATTAVSGAVTVTQNETHVASTGVTATALTTGSVTVNGGTTVTVNSLTTAAAGDEAGDILTTGTVAVNGKGTVTGVTVTQSAATVAYAAAGDKYKITNGVVTITDKNTADKTDTIKSVSLTNFGNSTITGNVLETLTLNGSAKSTVGLPSGTFGISQSASVKTAGTIPTALTLNATGYIGAVTDTNDQYVTLNIAAASAATIADLDFTGVTSLNISGGGVATISALTSLATAAAITATGVGAVITPALGTSQTFSGGDGKETITLGATTKVISMGAGDDTVTTGSAFGTGGSVDAGEGVDTLKMSAADAVTASAATTYETKVSGFEKLSIGQVAASGTVDLANLDDLNDVTVAGTDNATVLTIANATSGLNVRFADGTQTATTVSLSNSGTADVANVFVTTADNASTHTLMTLTGFETININSANTETTDDAVANLNTITTLTDADAKTVVVTGNAGLTLGTFSSTKVTSFDASGVTSGAVSYTAGALAAAATITGGAGADVLNAAAATKSVALSGGAGNDTLTGTKAADVIDGGTGTDTYVADATEQAGASTTKGQVINLSATELTASGVFTTTGSYLTSAAPTVAANTATYLFNGESSTNASTIDSLTSIENATGSSATDYIVGSADKNVINAGDGTDFVTGGDGADTFVFTYADNAGADGAAVADVITDFVAATDKLQFTGITDVVSGQQAAVQTAVTALAAGSTAAQIATAMAAANTTSLAVSFAVFEGNTYVYLEKTGATTTHVEADNIFIQLTGVTTVPTFAADVIA